MPVFLACIWTESSEILADFEGLVAVNDGSSDSVSADRVFPEGVGST